MGGGPKKDKKFVQKLMSQIKQGASELNIVNDKFGTPTYTVDFARTVKEINPKVLVAENVRGLLKHDDGRTLDTIKKIIPATSTAPSASAGV